MPGKDWLRWLGLGNGRPRGVSEDGGGGDESPGPGWGEGGGTWKSPWYSRSGVRAVTNRLQSPGRSSRIGEEVEESWLVGIPEEKGWVKRGCEPEGDPNEGAPWRADEAE